MSVSPPYIRLTGHYTQRICVLTLHVHRCMPALTSFRVAGNSDQSKSIDQHFFSLCLVSLRFPQLSGLPAILGVKHMCVYLCPGAISKFLHTNLHVSALCKVLEEASTICSDLSVLRRLSCAASTLHKDVPRYWDLVTEFGFQSTEDRSSIEKVQVLLENIQYMDTGTFDSDRCLMKELLDHQGFDGNRLVFLYLLRNHAIPAQEN